MNKRPIMRDPRRASRRDFLRGKLPSKSPPRVSASREDTPASDGDPTDQTYLIRVGRQAMACQFQVYLNAGQYAEGTEAAIAALDRVEQLEQILTVYREDSEVTYTNQLAAHEDVHVGAELYELLALSVQLHEDTGGAFDVTAGPLSDAWGFARRFGAMRDDAQLADALDKVGSRHLHLDDETHCVRFLRRGVQLNFGGIGKGYALDRGADLLRQAGIDDFLFHGGRSSVLARGRRSGDRQSADWSVGLIHPMRPEQRLGEIYLRGRAMSTSGSLTQSFYFQGQRYGHILDPRTGRPAKGVLSATVLAGSAAAADALSTALFVLGPGGTNEFCQQHPDVSAILVLPGPTLGTIVIECHNVADDEWQPHDDGTNVSID